MKLTRAEKLALVAAQTRELRDNYLIEPAGKKALLERLGEVERDLLDEVLSESEWSGHELRWVAYQELVRRAVLYRLAECYLTYEAMEREDPAGFNQQPDHVAALRWWRDEGGREQFLSEMSPSQRQKFELTEARRNRKNGRE